MKFSTAALIFAVSATASTAFVPHAFVSPKSPRPALFSTELRKTDVTADLKNGVTVNPFDQSALAAGVSPLTETGTATTSSSQHWDPQADAELAKLAAIEARAGAAAYMGQYEAQSGASLIYSKLVEHGVTVVNGFSGGAVLPLLDQFHEGHPRHETSGVTPIRWITNSNEASSGHIAEGYAKSMPINGPHKPVGVAVATSGPGVTNLITPLQDAICDGVPLVVLCGQAATVAPEDAFQSSPAVDLTRPCTKWSYQIKSAAEIPLVMDYAFYIARNGRPGPVFVDLPKDLLNQILTGDLINSFIDAENPGDETSFARLQKMYRPDGEVFQALHLGTGGKGLPFEIYKDEAAPQNTPTYKLKPVTHANTVDSYHADHHPSDRVIRTGKVVAGEHLPNEQGPLQVGGEMTKKITDLIMKAKKPVIIAGQGCNDASAELKIFADRLQIPVATTLHGLGCFDERSELALNMVGMHGHPTPNFMVQEADLIICVGSRFDDRITGRMSDFVPEARVAEEEGRGGVIHVDIRLTENAKQISPTFFVHSTGKKFLETMIEFLAGMDSKPNTSAWIKRMKELQKEYPVKIPSFPSETVSVTNEDGSTTETTRTRASAQSVVAELDRQLLAADAMDDAIFTTGVGIHQMVAAQLITWTQPRQMLSSGSLGTMGVALGYSIGAKLANADKMVIAVDGDGSFNMTFTELKTLAEQGIPVKIMILDNDGQMMVEYWQRLFHDNRLIAVRNSANPDYSTLAKAFGIKSVYCDCEEDLEARMKEFLFDDPDEPVLFHVRIERTPCLPLVAPGQPLQDMILEDVEVDVDKSAAPS
ncbi:carboxy-lyase [Phaeodactylum tricornutum CCAP 1055/1]|jgi:acetolactate synthase-1/2/3 large subunit|uniref:Carboxy-lyase n=1 Tax=Phaeodactylum tricornutum (strain CCAP 1055/1) TaxID=556484 RepID=B7G2T9_PHATC|nr:carboxy-lyase [Phaeodactylum tricornutum CCAP 1055/1]EEC47366.1 carboxy-lyase [Phaeodactylum tricornutum CCAP 1055/1]|eukprot:XP_002181443.1 carboxy-lyase [Phaeodactylum tricornutum CCAP 1055/1]